ncbi:MAG: AsmA family protein, partial [Polaromonas sp.]|nr:AsmA family protein [Polaromonas sp.]
MTPARKWLAGLGVAAAALALLGLVMARFIPSSEELAQRASARLEAVLGVPVDVGALQWRLFPSPRVVIEDVATRQTEPIELKMLTVYPRTAALWQLRLQVDRVELEGGVLPQLSLAELGAQALPAAEGPPPPSGANEVPLAHLVFHDVTWISRLGNHIVYDGDVEFDAGWRPRTARVRRPGFTPATDLALTRQGQGQEDRWDLRIRLGG